jgi:hypothetical protein
LYANDPQRRGPNALYQNQERQNLLNLSQLLLQLLIALSQTVDAQLPLRNILWSTMQQGVGIALSQGYGIYSCS